MNFLSVPVLKENQERWSSTLELELRFIDYKHETISLIFSDRISLDSVDIVTFVFKYVNADALEQKKGYKYWSKDVEMQEVRFWNFYKTNQKMARVIPKII